MSVNLKKAKAVDSFWPVEVSGDSAWREAVSLFMAAVAVSQRSAVSRLLDAVHVGGSGLRDWVSSIANRGAQIPDSIPERLIAVYLEDAEAMPLFDCEDCGLAVPVRPNRLYGSEAEPERIYFPTCPVCEGKTGMYFFWSRQAGPSPVADSFRPTKPR